MQSVPSLSAFLLLAFSPVAGAQQTIIVSGGGTALRDAVAAAAPGDILLVQPATYYDVVVDKGLSILCDPGVSIITTGPPSVPLAILDLPAGQDFAMRGGALGGLSLGPELLIARCASAVSLERVGTPRAIVLDSPQVAFLHMAINGGGASITNSSVSMVDCTLSGCVRFEDGICSTIHAATSTVSISGGSVTGSDQLLLPAARAITAIASRVTVTGDGATRLAAGHSGVPAIDMQGGQLRLDPIVQLVAFGSPVITGTGTVTSMPVPWVDADGVLSGQLFTATSHGEPGALIAVVSNTPAPPINSMFGDLWLQFPGFLIDAGVVPASRTRSRSYIVPPLPRGATFVYQAIELLNNGPLVVSPPTAVVFN